MDARFWRANVALLAAGFATFAALYDVQPLLPIFSKFFAVTPATASLAVSVTTVSLALSLLVAGPLAERFGRKGPMIASIGATAVVTLLCAITPNFPVLLILRVFAGITLAGLPAIAMAYLAEEIDAKKLGLAMGLYVSGTGLGGMCGRLLVGVVTQAAGWRAALATVGVLGVVCAAIVYALLPASQNFSPRSQSFAQARVVYRGHIGDAGLPWLYGMGFLAMGAFVTVYNYLGYRLAAPPFDLREGAIGAIFTVYLAGVVASAVTGRLADAYGRRNVMWISVLVMLAGVLLTLPDSLVAIVTGMAALTWGFFGVHSLASSWVGRRAVENKSHASSLYLFSYYLGSSVLGTLGGLAFGAGGWNATVGLVCAAMACALYVSTVVLRRLIPIVPVEVVLRG